MNWKYLLSVRGLNYWLLASGAGLSLIWAFVILMISYRLLSSSAQATFVQLGLMTGIFIGNFLIGWLIGKWAADGRGPTYGLYSSLGSVFLVLFVVLPAGMLGWLVAIMALAGGLNGGLATVRRRQPPHR